MSFKKYVYLSYFYCALLHAESDRAVDMFNILPPATSNEQFLNDTELTKAILGLRDPRFGVRADMVAVIEELSAGYNERAEQQYAHSRAHDLFMLAKTGDDAYNGYLFMTAAKNCLASKGVGDIGALNILMRLSEKQINTELRRIAVSKAESLLRKGDYPPLELFDNNADYCVYTSFNIPETNISRFNKDSH